MIIIVFPNASPSVHLVKQYLSRAWIHLELANPNNRHFCISTLSISQLFNSESSSLINLLLQFENLPTIPIHPYRIK